jgi:hypothetical protein
MNKLMHWCIMLAIGFGPFIIAGIIFGNLHDYYMAQP